MSTSQESTFDLPASHELLRASPQESAPLASRGSSTAAGATVLKAELPASARHVVLVFNPVAAEDVQQTRELNQAMRLGFAPPLASTR